jgi:hypothetical protein
MERKRAKTWCHKNQQLWTGDWGEWVVWKSGVQVLAPDMESEKRKVTRDMLIRIANGIPQGPKWKDTVDP